MTYILPRTENLAVPLEWQAFDQKYEQDYPGSNGDFTSQHNIGVVLGPGDPEMDAAARLLWRQGIPFVNARAEDGSRARPAEAYRAQFDEQTMERVRGFGKVATIECAVVDLVPDEAIDHHGDKGPVGLDRSFKNAFRASSLGQLVSWLSIETGRPVQPTRQEVIIGALDHCASRVLHGEYEEVSPEEATNVMIHEIVRGARQEESPSEKSVAEVGAKVEALVNLIETSEEVEINGQLVVDLRHIELQPGYCEDSLVIKTAAGIAGKAAWILTPDDGNGGRVKESFTGLVTAEHVQAFETRIVQTGMRQAITDQSRGIAMAYVNNDSWESAA